MGARVDLLIGCGIPLVGSSFEGRSDHVQKEGSAFLSVLEGLTIWYAGAPCTCEDGGGQCSTKYLQALRARPIGSPT